MNMREPQLIEKLTELKKEMIKNNAQIAIGTVPENPGRVREIKKTIARINTLLRKLKDEPKTEEKVEEKKTEKPEKAEKTKKEEKKSNKKAEKLSKKLKESKKKA